MGPTLCCTGFFTMERFLLLWDEIDDLMGASRYYVKNTAMVLWSLRRKA
jgi:hypothetical protein